MTPAAYWSAFAAWTAGPIEAPEAARSLATIADFLRP